MLQYLRITSAVDTISVIVYSVVPEAVICVLAMHTAHTGVTDVSAEISKPNVDFCIRNRLNQFTLGLVQI
jgi:hypothetical protein